MTANGSDIWVFGYGSLMWDPGFRHEEAVPALLEGYHRAFCIYSHQYRGTKEKPGLVLGLRPGGQCLGMAFRVAAADVPAALDYLTDREMTTYVYTPKKLKVKVGSHYVEAQTYVADSTHPEYAGELTPEETAALICRGLGQRGPNRDYLENTVRHLEELGVDEPSLKLLCDLVRRLASEGLSR